MGGGDSGVDDAQADAGAVDWAQVIRARLTGTQPRHAPPDWLVPGAWERAAAGTRRYFPEQPIPAAVLMPLIEREELSVLLTQRATQLRNHAGQVSFPGGRIEPGDDSPSAAALREAQEEIGLEAQFVSVIGYLPDHLVITGFRVTPVVAFVRPGFTLRPDPSEVEETFEVPLRHVFDPANHHPERRRSHFTGEEVEFIDIRYGERRIWGATAGILMTLYRLCIAPARHE